MNFLTRNTLFPLPNVTPRDAASLIRDSVAGLLTGSGSSAERTGFEKAFDGHAAGSESIAFPSGRSALAALLLANGVRPGDEVLITGFTCEAVVQPVLAIGARPRWVDIDRQTLSMDLEAAQSAITPAVRAIVLQHSFGIPADVERFRTHAVSRGVALVEDCCLALGSRHPDGRLIGTGESDAFWSFEVTKTISAGWGGVASVKDPKRAAKVRDTRDSAGDRGRLDAARTLAQAGISALCYRPRFAGLLAYLPVALDRMGVFRSSDKRTGGMTSETAFEAYGRAGPDLAWRYLTRQFERLDEQISRVRRINDAYFEALASSGVRIPEQWLANTTVMLRVPVLVKDTERFDAHLRAGGVDTGHWFDWPVAADNSGHEYGYVPGSCPTGEAVAKSISNVPSHARMSDEDVRIATESVGAYFRENPDEAIYMNELLNKRI